MIPMPSPRNTNHERLYLPWPSRSPVGAYDSARGLRHRRAYDEEPTLESAKHVLEAYIRNLDDADAEELLDHVERLGEDRRRRRDASDRRGGRNRHRTSRDYRHHAMDSAIRDPHTALAVSGLRANLARIGRV